MKLLLVLAFTFTPSILAATPPACLLSAINTQTNPSDLNTLCDTSSASKVQSAIASLCTGDNVSVAQSAFVSTCSIAGKTVSPYVASSTSTSGVSIYTTAMFDSSCSCTKTTTITSTSGTSTARLSAPSGGASNSSSSGVGNASGRSGGNTGSAGATSTAGAMPQGEKNRRMGGYAAAAVALVGVVGAL